MKTWTPPHVDLGTCADCHWNHPAESCGQLAGAIDRLEREVAEQQKRLDSLRVTWSKRTNRR